MLSTTSLFGTTTSATSSRAMWRWLAMVSTAFVVAVAPTHYDADANTSKGKTPTSKLFSGRIQIAVPKAANKPQKVSASMYSIRPKSASQKFVIFVTKDALRKDELKKSNKELGTSIKELLQAQGYEITSLTNKGTTYTVTFRGYTNVPWQPVGTTATRGTATFQRTQDNQLLGSMLLCDPNQWDDPAIGQFKKAVSGVKITTK